MNKQFPLPLERWITRLAILAIVVGVVLIAFAGWEIAGGAIIAFGILSLFVAYHMGAAPRVEEVGSEFYVAVKEPGEALVDGEEELQPEWLPESSLRNAANR